MSFFGGAFFGGGFFGGGGAEEAPRSIGGTPHGFFEREFRESFRPREEKAREIVRQVAQRQAERLETDEQKQFEELARELELQTIEFDGRYLTALAQLRESLIEEEIGILLRKKLFEEEALLLILIGANLT